MTTGNVLDDLSNLVRESTDKRQSFLLAITKSSKAISDGANKWFCAEADLLKKEIELLQKILPAEVGDWNARLEVISNRFRRALSFLEKIIAKAQDGKIVSFNEVNPPLKPKKVSFNLTEFSEVKEEEKELNLVSAMLEVFDSASDLEKLIKEIERESERTINTARLVMQVIQTTKK